jgi:mercuric ion binding protein
MKKLSLVLGLCLLFTVGFSVEITAISTVEVVSTTLKLKTVTFKVYGNCGMCKSTIEQSLKGVKGVAAATWDVDAKMITVTYNPKKIELLDIHQKIAGVGYDTDKMKAKDEIYSNLHGCCQYDRPEGE